MLPGSTINHVFYLKTLGSVLTADSMPVCTLIRGGIDTVVAVTVSQLADNGYSASFTIPSNWQAGEAVQLRISAIVGGFSVPPKTINLGTIESPFTGSDRVALLSTQSDAAKSRKGVTNHYKIDETANTGTLYDDDGTTPLVTHNLKDKDGNPAHSEVYERVP